MVRIVRGGRAANDAERKVIGYLQRHAPDGWIVLHNVEVPLRGAKYEIDVIVITGHSVALIDVKGTHGRIEVERGTWYPSRRKSFPSPVQKLRAHARSFHGQLERRDVRLNRVFVDALVVLADDDAVLIDPNSGLYAEANDVTYLDGLIPALQDVSRVRAGKLRDLGPHREAIRQAIEGSVQTPTGPPRFGNWVVTERLGGTDEVTEYRAVNALLSDGRTALLRVHQVDAFAPEAERAAERIAIANAYDTLRRMPPHECVMRLSEFFGTDDEDRYVEVLDDLPGDSLHLLVNDPRRRLGVDARHRVIRDVLAGLAHAHAHQVIHRALSPTSVLVMPTGRAVLTGFGYARPEGARAHTVRDRLVEVLDPAYVAPECQEGRAQAMSRKSDVYAAGVIAFQLLTGELPFATSVEQYEKGSELPGRVMAAAGVPDELAAVLRRLCALAPSARPDATEALDQLLAALGGGGGGSGVRDRAARRDSGGPDYQNLPVGHRLTPKYTVRRKLGTGTFGAVYQVYDDLLDTDYAVKIVYKDPESLVDRVRQEYAALRGLHHRNVVKIENADYLENGRVPYLVFEYLDGQDVNDLVDGRQLGPADTRKLGIDVARGLAFLHENSVYHCDIKPHNLLRTDQGCKIIDFNVAVRAGTSLSKVGGSPKYQPPDVAAQTTADLADRDVFALGLTLYQVLTGAWAYPSAGRPQLGEQPIDPADRGVTGLSEEFTAVLLKAVAPQRGDRFGSAAELLAALEAVEEVHRPPPAPPPAPVKIVKASGVNPFVDHLKTLYSQSTSSNAGTRGHDAYDLYVKTALDKALTTDVLDGIFRLVVITGNAGDGKTAFLEHVVNEAVERYGAELGPARDNGADVRFRDGGRLRTNHDGSQDEGDKVNDAVLLDFFAPYSGDGPFESDATTSGDGEIRLIAINEGRLIDFLTDHATRFGRLSDIVRAGLEGREISDGIAVVNLNRRSVVADEDALNGSIFDRLLRRMTHERLWEDCRSCELVDKCYARHNAQTFAHPSAGVKVIDRLTELYRMTHLRGRMHMTLRDLRSALAFTLTSGRGCAEIHDLYRAGDAEAILDGFYFNSWAGLPGTRDRLLAHLRDVDVALVPEPALDRQIDYVGPDAGQAVMTVDQRGDYDVQLLRRLFDELPRATKPSGGQMAAHTRYLAAARRRFFFECVDERRSRRLLPYRSAERYLELLDSPASVPGHKAEIIEAINRGEGLPDPKRLGDDLALQVREVPGGTIRSYRLFPSAELSLAISGGGSSPYLEQQPAGLVLRYHGYQEQEARLEIRLDLYELLYRLRHGYLPGVAEEQGLLLGLRIFKNALAAAPYQEIVLTTGGDDLRYVRREPNGRLIMESPKAGGE